MDPNKLIILTIVSDSEQPNISLEYTNISTKLTWGKYRANLFEKILVTSNTLSALFYEQAIFRRVKVRLRTIFLMATVSILASIAISQGTERHKLNEGRPRQTVGEPLETYRLMPGQRDEQKQRYQKDELKNTKLPFNLGSLACPPDMDCKEKEDLIK